MGRHLAVVTILARHFIELSESKRPRSPGRGLELGCGVGLVTTAAMIAGYDMIASDYYTDALAFTRANAFRNTGKSPAAPMIDWRHFPRDVKGPRPDISRLTSFTKKNTPGFFRAFSSAL